MGRAGRSQGLLYGNDGRSGRHVGLSAANQQQKQKKEPFFNRVCH